MAGESVLGTARALRASAQAPRRPLCCLLMRQPVALSRSNQSSAVNFDLSSLLKVSGAPNIASAARQKSLVGASERR